MPEYLEYRLVRRVGKGERPLIMAEVIGIVAVPPISYPIVVKLDSILSLRTGEWFWEKISQVEFETYKEFGFKEYKV